MNLKLIGAFTLAAVLAPAVASAEPVYTDTQPYQVSSQFPYVAYPSGYQMDDRYPWDTTSYTFDPYRTYSTSEQQTVIMQEAGLTSAVMTMDTSGAQVLEIDQGRIPESYIQTAPPPVEQSPVGDMGTWGEMGTADATFNKTYYRSEGFGNSLFGAKYVINAAVTATPATSGQAKKVEAFGEGKVLGTAFSYEKELVRARADIYGQQGGSNGGSAGLFAMGQQIWSANLSYTFGPAPIDWSRTFFSVSKTFVVGPVPITVKASLAGGVKFSLVGEIAPTVARLTVNSGGWSNVTASASVNIIVARFGVEGSLSLINVTLPAVGELFWPICSLDWTLRSNLNLNTLSGQLKLFAEIRLLFFKKKWSTTIASWSGITRNWQLLNINGTQELGICMY
ncbi:hypothetical protein NR798_28180 [Archangium gephyra]|uniref:hypothetical protein n=1 Tax=Archangium gephyra TaxID=48 RepID=UPI0035D4721C